MKHLPVVALLFALGFWMNGCAVCHSYGPYKGKVIEAQTQEPVEGAVVLFEFYTTGIFYESHYADAVEKVTDALGEFELKNYYIAIIPRLFHRWDEYSSFIIYKPGYREYSSCTAKYNKMNSEDKLVIEMKKLNSMKERKKNLPSYLLEIPKRKCEKIRELEKKEYNFLFRKRKGRR